MYRALSSLTLGTCLTAVAFADPVISEFMASNQSTLADEDGAYSDWIEIHNPDATPVSLDQWCLTDSASNRTKWRFPAVTLQPGEFLVVWASGKNRRVPGQPLHTNFSLSADGEYLGLIRADGQTVVHHFSPSYPPLAGDESFGSVFDRQVLLSSGASTRYRVPASATDPGSDWVQPSFPDAAWASGPSGLGHGLTVPGITVRHVFKNGSVSGLADAVNLVNLPPGDPGILRESTATVEVVNFLGEGSDGRFGGNAVPPGGSGDHYAIRATGFIYIPVAGYYTFGLNSDDGGRIRINGTDVMVDDTFHGPLDNFGGRNLGVGLHSFEAIQFEGAGGDCMEFFAAPGVHTSWNATAFRLVGDTANGGLAASTMPEGAGGFFSTNLQAAMAGKPGAFFRTGFTAPGPGTATSLSLVTRHNDGFAAWLNGTPVASDNAPANPQWSDVALGERSNAASLQPSAFNLTAHLPLLNAGSNLLAIHGMKSSAAEGSFLILPELVAGRVDTVHTPAFFRDGRATPGWINEEPSSLGKVAVPQISVARGIFSQPFQLTLTSVTPGADVRYTTDGSTPSATNGTTYTGPFTVSSTTVLRVCGAREDWETSPVETHTYLFFDDVITQSSSPPGWPASSGTSQVMDYGMDPDIVNSTNPDIGGPASVKAALAALPSVSIVTDLPNLLNINGSQGIYSNPNGRGFGWERPASLEWINPPSSSHPNGTSEFQINAGLRLRGGFSRSTDNPKHSFRFFFRGDYGPTKLEYPLFGRRGAQVFNQIDFRTSQNYSWAFGGDDNNTFLREESTRVAQLDMGQPSSRVRYFHLYLNGHYWGLFNLDERTEADFAETYFGGKAEDYDVVKAEQTANYTVGATDGNLTAWRDLWDRSKAHRANPTNANYFRMMGLAADGVTRTADPVLLDDNNLIDYLLLTFWTGNLDGCTSAFLGNDRANNWFGSRRRDGNTGQGFRFFAHDFEHSFFNVNEDRTGPFTAPNEANFDYSNPLFLHQDLTGNAEYRMRWADRIQKHLFNGGALESAAWLNRINKLAADVDQSIIAESARWGDAKSSTPKNRQTWIGAQNRLLNYLPQRTPVVLAQLRADGLYPSVDAPQVTPFGGFQNNGVEVVISAPTGTLYYMPDGSDPRAIGGALKNGALTYTSSTSQDALIPWSASGWKYLATGSNQGTAWREPGFNDASWPTGAAELGYGDGDEATVVGNFPNPKPATCYFRRAFDVAELTGITNLTATIKYDDAYAIYLNGTRVAGNLPVDPPFNYYTDAPIEDTQVSVQIPASLLVAGTNLIAVEIHKENATSSDLSMNLSLTATRSNTATPLLLTGGGERPFRVRARSGATWSALTEATFLLDSEPASPANIAISEIHYHPSDPTPAETAAGHDDANDFEFIEILNTGTRHVDLDGVYIYGAVTFDFTGAATGRTLAPGGRVVIVSNLDAFRFRYGANPPVAGQYSGQLDNAGETITLHTPDDAILRQVPYSDNAPWPLPADGEGYSLVRRHPSEPGGDADPTGWTISGEAGGSPGEEGTFMPGTYDAWAATAFPPAQRASSATSGVSADPDGDGRTNAEEYAFVTDPLVADRPESSFEWAEGHAGVRFRRPEGPLDVLYELLVSDDLEGPWEPVETVAHDSTSEGDGIESAVFRDPEAPDGARRFLRIRATWEP